jgi:hypothetical protein
MRTAGCPLPLALADVICLRQSRDAIPPHARDRLAITLVRSSIVIRCESRRKLTADPGTVLVVPAGEVFSAQALGSWPCSLQTLLVGPEHLVTAPPRQAFVNDSWMTAELSALMDDLERPSTPPHVWTAFVS